MKAFQVSGYIDENRELHLDAPLAAADAGRVKAIILAPEDNELTETEWLHAVAHNTVFDFLNDPEEDIYCATDGIGI